jgi:RNA polymerase sigma-70 factor (ECF subfamily)
MGNHTVLRETKGNIVNDQMDAKDFNERIVPISDKLLLIATHMLKDEQKAKDVVQDVFLKLWNKRNALQKIENLEAYAKRMCRNRCIDVIRANRIVHLDEQAALHIEEKTTDIQTKIELSELALEIRKIIDSLPYLQRTVMTLRDLEHCTVDEIQEKTKLNKNAVRVNLSRARHRVRIELLKRRKHGKGSNKNISTKIL